MSEDSQKEIDVLQKIIKELSALDDEVKKRIAGADILMANSFEDLARKIAGGVKK